MGRDPDVFHARLGTSVEYDMVWFSVVIFTIWKITSCWKCCFLSIHRGWPWLPPVLQVHMTTMLFQASAFWKPGRSLQAWYQQVPCQRSRTGSNKKTLRFLFASCKILRTLVGSFENKEILWRLSEDHLFPCFFPRILLPLPFCDSKRRRP